jgi:hypothetical protein
MPQSRSIVLVLDFAKGFFAQYRGVTIKNENISLLTKKHVPLINNELKAIDSLRDNWVE